MCVLFVEAKDSKIYTTKSKDRLFKKKRGGGEEYIFRKCRGYLINLVFNAN